MNLTDPILPYSEIMHGRGSQQSVRRQWSSQSMKAAVKAVGEGMGFREASRLYNLPFELFGEEWQSNV